MSCAKPWHRPAYSARLVALEETIWHRHGVADTRHAAALVFPVVAPRYHDVVPPMLPGMPALRR